MAISQQIEDLQERLTALNDEAHSIQTQANAEKRDLSVEETKKIDTILEEFDRVEGDVNRLTKLSRQTEKLTTPTGRKTEPEEPKKLSPDPSKDIKIPPELDRTPKNGGFRNIGELALSVRRACIDGGFTDGRLERLAAATIIANESTGADGGFAVPVDFRTAIMQKVMGEDSLLPRCTIDTVSGNSITLPTDETTPWQTTGGILANWDGESVAATQSKPQIREETTKLNKLRVLVPVTEELFDDAAGMDSYLRRKAPEKIDFKVNLAILQGSGVGQPLGILPCPALVSVAKVASQVADTVVGVNVINMYSRMLAQHRRNAVWLINQDIEPQLLTLMKVGKIDTGAADTGWGVPLYLPPNGLSGAPFGTLFGKEVLPTQACETLGDKGDILFVDLSQYHVLLKSGSNPKADVSIHLWFDQDLLAYKFTLRMGGKPMWGSTIAARDGSTTYSPYVTLDERA